MKTIKEHNLKCEMCEIILDVPNNFKIFQYAPLRMHRLLVILTSGHETISYITAYTESNKYIFRRKSDNGVILIHSEEVYGC
jgi:hypothetical protein